MNVWGNRSIDILVNELAAAGLVVVISRISIAFDLFRPFTVSDPKNHQLQPPYSEVVSREANIVSEPKQTSTADISYRLYGVVRPCFFQLFQSIAMQRKRVSSVVTVSRGFYLGFEMYPNSFQLLLVADNLFRRHTV